MKSTFSNTLAITLILVSLLMLSSCGESSNDYAKRAGVTDTKVIQSCKGSWSFVDCIASYQQVEVLREIRDELIKLNAKLEAEK